MICFQTYDHVKVLLRYATIAFSVFLLESGCAFKNEKDNFYEQCVDKKTNNLYNKTIDKDKKSLDDCKNSISGFNDIFIVYDKINKDLSILNHEEKLFDLGKIRGGIKILEVSEKDTTEIFKSFCCSRYFYENSFIKKVSLFVWEEISIWEGSDFECTIFAYDLEGVDEAYEGDLPDYEMIDKEPIDPITAILKIDFYFAENGVESISVSDLGKKMWGGFLTKDTIKKQIITDFKVLDRELSYNSIARYFMLDNFGVLSNSNNIIFSSQGDPTTCNYCQLMLLILENFKDLYIHEMDLKISEHLTINTFVENLVNNFLNCYYYIDVNGCASSELFSREVNKEYMIYRFYEFLHAYNFFKFLKPLSSNTYKGEDINLFIDGIKNYHKLYDKYPRHLIISDENTIWINLINEELKNNALFKISK